MDHSQRTLAIQDGMVLWVAELSVVVQGLGEPHRVELPKIEPLGRRKGQKEVQQKPAIRLYISELEK